MKKSSLGLLLAGLLLAAGAYAGTADHVSATHAWIRILPGDLPAGAYVTLENDNGQAIALVGASSPTYAEVMLHKSSSAGGMSRMSMVESLDIPAHGTVALTPGGYHLMLMKAVHPVHPGDTVRLVLKFSDGSTLPATFTARPANAVDDSDEPAMPASMHMHHAHPADAGH